MFFFFSSRRRHTRWPRDWSSDVCSSDLPDYRSLDVVRSDHRHGVELAVDHLVAGGHRRILLLARQDSPTARSISTSFVDIMRQRSVIESWVTALSSPDSDPGAGSPDSAVGVDGIGSGARSEEHTSE